MIKTKTSKTYTNTNDQKTKKKKKKKYKTNKINFLPDIRKLLTKEKQKQDVRKLITKENVPKRTKKQKSKMETIDDQRNVQNKIYGNWWQNYTAV